MATHLNTRSPNQGVQRGFLGRVVDAIREVISPPSLRAQDTQRGSDRYMKGNPYRVASQRSLTTVTSGRNSLQSRTNVPDAQILGFLDTLSRTPGR